MAFSKASLLEKAIEITKAYASSANSTNVHETLQDVYEKLVELNESLEK